MGGDTLIRRNIAAAFRLVLWLGAVLVPLSSTGAHPHSWIDLRTIAIFDEQGRIAALRILWTFDEFYTTFAIEGMDKDGDGVPDDASLRALAEASTKGLAEYSYFTFMEFEGKPVAYMPIRDVEATYFQNRLGLVFTLPLSEPVDPRKSGFVYRNYDPTYYIEILHVKDKPILFEGKAPADCRYDVAAPNPDMKVLSLAQSLDRSQTAGDGLGQHFAETATIHCP
jgi:ABC-type uncharacterized transport system substrate-binding protein